MVYLKKCLCNFYAVKLCGTRFFKDKPYCILINIVLFFVAVNTDFNRLNGFGLIMYKSDKPNIYPRSKAHGR